MSSDSKEKSREALELSEDELKKLEFEIRPLSPIVMNQWLEIPENREKFDRANETVKEMVKKKLLKLEIVEQMLEAKKAPAFIKELSKSDPTKPPESQDVEYLTWEEVTLDRAIHTINKVLVRDFEISVDTHLGPWIYDCIGVNPQTLKHQVMKVPAKERDVPPWEIMRYLGNVVSDHQAVHSSFVVMGGNRRGYVFDRFYYDQGKRLDRCCWVPDKIHQAGLMYEKFIDKQSKKALARVARLGNTDSPKYEVVGAKAEGATAEGYYRNLKRLYESHFIRRRDGQIPVDDAALNALINKINP